jgi:ribosome assembly protein SQT1
MSAYPQPYDNEEDEEFSLNDEDIVEVHDDSGDDEPMDDDDDDDDDDGGAQDYGGEIVVGAPQPGEEEELMGEGGVREDNSWGATSECSSSQSGCAVSPLRS